MNDLNRYDFDAEELADKNSLDPKRFKGMQGESLEEVVKFYGQSSGTGVGKYGTRPTAATPKQLVKYFTGSNFSRTDYDLAHDIEAYATDNNLVIQHIGYSVGQRTGHAMVVFVERTEHIKDSQK